MNISQRIPAFALFLLTLIATSCSKEKEHNSFLIENGITETNRVPFDYSNGNIWKPLAGGYVYFVDLFQINNSSELVCILANKKENKLLSVYHINPHVMPATYARGVNPPTVVTNYQEISESDLERSDDMTAFNAFLKNIPEMKDFSWKNEVQNTIVSALIFKTHFVYATNDSVDDKLFRYEEKLVKQDQKQLLQQIFAGKYSLFNRPVKRLNENVEMYQYVKDMGFFFEGNSPESNGQSTEKYYINDLVKKPIDFKVPGKLCLFYPFKSFIRIQNKGETPFYDPAVASCEYSFVPDSDGFPKFKRVTQFASLLKDNIRKN